MSEFVACEVLILGTEVRAMNALLSDTFCDEDFAAPNGFVRP